MPSQLPGNAKAMLTGTRWAPDAHLMRICRASDVDLMAPGDLQVPIW
jgi:hypothetical protein